MGNNSGAINLSLPCQTETLPMTPEKTLKMTLTTPTLTLDRGRKLYAQGQRRGSRCLQQPARGKRLRWDRRSSCCTSGSNDKREDDEDDEPLGSDMDVDNSNAGGVMSMGDPLSAARHGTSHVFGGNFKVCLLLSLSCSTVL